MPVALEQAASYICQRRIGFGTYLQDLGESREDVLAWHKDELNYPEAVLTAWQTTNKRLGPSEQGILRLASFLAPEAIPAALFESQPEKIKEAAGLILEETAPAPQLSDEEDAPDVRSLLAELAGWSMITLAEESFTMHRLVQDSIRLSIPDDRRKPWAKLALELINQYIPAEPPPNDVHSWDTWKLVDSHVVAIIAHADGLGIGEPTTRLMACLAVYSNARARFDEAEPLMRRALEIDEQSFGKDHPNVTRDLNNLAQLLQATNRLDEAKPLMRRVVEILENPRGEPLPNYAGALNNLAGLLKATNRLAEAEPLMRRALAIDEQSLGKDHPKVAIHLNNLAALLQATNRLDEAEPLTRRALEIDEQSFGKDHPEVAINMNNLAQLLKATNRLDEAEPLYRRALEINEQSFGKDHPKVAFGLNNLALLLHDTNRLAQAEPLMRRALEIFEKSLGPDHPNTQTARENLESLKQKTKPNSD